MYGMILYARHREIKWVVSTSPCPVHKRELVPQNWDGSLYPGSFLLLNGVTSLLLPVLGLVHFSKGRKDSRGKVEEEV